jgi:putative transcriptional regulator
MIRFRLPELLLEKERREGRRIAWSEVAQATGVSRQVLANLASRDRMVVTNTAFVESLCRYFGCLVQDLIEFSPPLDGHLGCHVDVLYPDRRRTTGT